LDPAEALPADHPGQPDVGKGVPVGEPPSIGVPAIPASPDRTRPPVTVPSAVVPETIDPDPGPDPDPMVRSPLQLAPLPVAGPDAAAPDEPVVLPHEPPVPERGAVGVLAAGTSDLGVAGEANPCRKAQRRTVARSTSSPQRRRVSEAVKL